MGSRAMGRKPLTYSVNDFSAGELSQKVSGRIDLPMYRSGAREMYNMIPLPSGGATKRPGTRYLGQAKHADRVCRLVYWTVSPEVTEVLEIGHEYTRIWKSDGTLLLSGSNPVELATPWSETELGDVRLAQIGNAQFGVMYLVHPAHPVQRITRTAPSTWAVTTVTFTAGASDQAFDSAGNYPSQVELYEDRLYLAATDLQPNTFWASKVGEYEDFTLGTNDADAWERPIQAKERPTIRWMSAGNAMTFGTEAGAWRMGGQENVLTPGVRPWPRKQSAVGSSSVQPLMIDDAVVFVQRGGKRLRRFAYSEPIDQYAAMDVSLMADHIPAAGVVDMAYQREPESVLWVRMADGSVAAFSYSMQAQMAAWSRVDFGGPVDSICTVATAGEDELWILVQRVVDGTLRRYIERTTVREWSELSQAVYLDSSVTWYGGPARTVTSVSNEDPAVATVPGHGFSAGDFVRFRGTGAAEGLDDLDGEVFAVADPTTDTFSLLWRDGASPVDFSLLGEPLTGGIVERVTNVITDLEHLEGEQVWATADGAVVSPVMVESGVALFGDYGNRMQVGLLYRAVLEPMAVAAAAHKIKRIHSLYGRFYKTFGAKAGESEDRLELIVFEPGEPVMGAPPALVTGVLPTPYQGDFDRDARIRIVSDIPMPMTVLSLTAEMEVQR